MLNQDVLQQINSVSTRLKIAMALNVSESTIIRYIDLNHANLTKAAAMKIIREVTGLNDDQILLNEIIA